MSDRGDTEDAPKVPDNAGTNDEGRDSIETVSRDAASKDSLSSAAFGQGSSSFMQSLESMGQSLKKGSELAMAQFGQLTLFDSQDSKRESGKENGQKSENEKEKGNEKGAEKRGNDAGEKGSSRPTNDTNEKGSAKPGEKSEKKEEKKNENEPDEFEQLLKDINDPVKQEQQKKEAAEKEAKQTKEFDEKAASRKPPKEGEALDTEASKEGTKDYLKKLPDLDYKNVLKGHQVTLLGEHHLDGAAKQHVADYAKRMNEAGATHFAVETIPQSMQPTLDKFMNGDKDARKEIEKHIMDTWDKSYPGTGEKYMKMLDSVKDSGMKIVGMDVNGHIDKDEKGRTERDKAWSDSIANILKNDPSAKVVAFGGSGHFERNTAWTKSTNEFLKNDHKIDAQVLNLSGLPAKSSDKHDESLRENERNPQYRLALYGKEAGQDGRSIFVPLAPKSDSKYDGFIFLPRK